MPRRAADKTHPDYHESNDLLEYYKELEEQGPQVILENTEKVSAQENSDLAYEVKKNLEKDPVFLKIQRESQKLKNLWKIKMCSFFFKQGRFDLKRLDLSDHGGYFDQAKLVYKPTIWESIVLQSREWKVHPYSLVFSVFPEFVTADLVPPIPQSLLKLETLQKYRELEQEEAKNFPVKFCLEKSLAFASYQMVSRSSLMSAESARRNILQKIDNNISPLMRYCLAYKFNYVDLANRWYVLAKLQFLEFPYLYIVVWKDLITADLVELVKFYNVV